MSSISAPTLFTLSAPSGTGKTSLIKALLTQNASLRTSISHTTRDQREGETNKVDYHFVAKEEFLKMIDEQAFLEYAQVYGNFYGTSKIEVSKYLKQGINVILDIDWQGAKKVKEAMPESVSITVIPPSIDELERRLRDRNTDTVAVINKRMQQAREEISNCRDADHIVLNDDFNLALSDLSLIIDGKSDKIRPLGIDLDHLLQV